MDAYLTKTYLLFVTYFIIWLGQTGFSLAKIRA